MEEKLPRLINGIINEFVKHSLKDLINKNLAMNEFAHYHQFYRG